MRARPRRADHLRLRNYCWRLRAVVLECRLDGHVSRLFQPVGTAQRTRTGPDTPASARRRRRAGETRSHRTQRLDWFRLVRAARRDDWRRLGRWRPFRRGRGRAVLLGGGRQSGACDSPARAPLVPRFINTTTFVASIFGSGVARRGSIPRSGAVTEEQRSQNRKATQPSGRRFFSSQTSLLAPYRPLKGMRVARASSGPKIPRHKRGRIYETGYLGNGP